MRRSPSRRSRQPHPTPPAATDRLGRPRSRRLLTLAFALLLLVAGGVVIATTTHLPAAQADDVDGDGIDDDDGCCDIDVGISGNPTDTGGSDGGGSGGGGSGGGGSGGGGDASEEEAEAAVDAVNTATDAYNAVVDAATTVQQIAPGSPMAAQQQSIHTWAHLHWNTALEGFKMGSSGTVANATQQVGAAAQEMAQVTFSTINWAAQNNPNADLAKAHAEATKAEQLAHATVLASQHLRASMNQGKSKDKDKNPDDE
jgi:hypothetical protein